jgi:ankyrin repeat protein
MLSDVKSVKSYLKHNKITADKLSDYIIFSSERGMHESLKLFLEHTDIMGDGLTLNAALECAFIFGCEKNKPKIVKLLLDHGADPSINNNKWIINATSNGYNEIVELLLKHPKTDPSVKRNLVLKFACLRGDVNLVALLLRHPKVNPTDRENAAFKIAACNGHLHIMKLLASDNRIYLSVERNVAVKLAYYNGHENIVNYLLDHPSVTMNNTAATRLALGTDYMFRKCYNTLTFTSIL